MNPIPGWRRTHKMKWQMLPIDDSISFPLRFYLLTWFFDIYYLIWIKIILDQVFAPCIRNDLFKHHFLYIDLYVYQNFFRGEDFRKVYGDLLSIRGLVNKTVRIMCLTGTVTAKSYKAIKEGIKLKSTVTVSKKINRPNILWV